MPKGELFGFSVPTAGKTTTLRMIAGILRPTAGSSASAVFDIAADPIAAKKILGFIPGPPVHLREAHRHRIPRFVAGLYGQDGRTSSIAAGAAGMFD